MQAIEEIFLDVTILEPSKKHSTIFNQFDSLNNNESLVIVNDHDPKPLYYQMKAEWGNIFSWNYLEQGPENWKVRITKKHEIKDAETLGDIAAKDIRKALVFKKFGLDFCCGGKRTLYEACTSKKIDSNIVEQELNNIDKLASLNVKPLPYNDWALDFLADYIVNTHHTYVQKTLPDMVTFSAKVARVHGERNPELIQINQLVNELNVELLSHMIKEEKILFPYVKELVNTSKENKNSIQSHFGTIQNPINMMEMEHEVAGTLLEKIRNLTSNYTLPQNACGTYSLLYRLLEEFEDDLHTHIHLENNILFPKAIELENQLISGESKVN